jgi:fumarylpyruvate hydrolase
MTRRDLQFAMRDKGRPWDVSKGFDHSAPIAPIHPLADVGDITNATIALDVNGAPRQSSSIAKLIWNVAETIAHLSTYFELAPGDLIFTGTPEGVGAVVSGDLLEGRIDGLGDLRVRIA